MHPGSDRAHYDAKKAVNPHRTLSQLYNMVNITYGNPSHGLPEPSHTSYHQVVTGKGASFVKAANLNFPSKGNSERFCAVHI